MRLKSRGVLLIALSLLTLAGILAYSGPAIGVVFYRLVTDGAVLLAWALGAAGAGAFLNRVFFGRETAAPVALRIATALGVGLGGVSLVSLGLGLVGGLNGITAWILVGAGIVLGALSLREHAATWTKSVGEWLNQPAGWEWLVLLETPFLVVMGVGAMVLPGFLWNPEEPHGYDVVEYHLQVPREWYEAGRILPLHHNVFSYFPFNVEMHYLLAMHLRGGPWVAMYLTQLMHGVFVLVSILAVYGFARRAAPRRAAVIGALAVATVPMLAQLGAIAYDEGGLLLFGTLAIGWAMVALLEPERRLIRFALAGVMAGLACGTKLTGVQEVVFAIGLVGAGVGLFGRALAPDNSRRHVFLGLVLFGLVAVLVFSPWLLRNVVWVKNPVFPEGMKLFGRGGFSDLEVERWEHAHAAAAESRSAAGRLVAFGRQVLGNWQFGYVLLPLACVAIYLCRRQRETQFLAGILLVLLAFWLGFTHLQGRFFILAVPVCGMLVARIDWKKWASAGVVLVLLAAGAGAARLHLRLVDRLYGAGQLAQTLGTEDLSWIQPDAMDKIPSDARIMLVGDARAFWFTRPMALLSYRTVFDADTSGGRGVFEAWAGPVQQRKGAWLVVDPDELRRFAKTYPPFPPLPPEVKDRSGAFAIPPGQQK